MSVYSVKGKGWRYDFILDGERYTSNWFENKGGGQRGRNRQKGGNQESETGTSERNDPTAMAFLELVNRRLDHVKAYNSERHYSDHVYMAKKWIERVEKLELPGSLPG